MTDKAPLPSHVFVRDRGLNADSRDAFATVRWPDENLADWHQDIILEDASDPFAVGRTLTCYHIRDVFEALYKWHVDPSPENTEALKKQAEEAFTREVYPLPANEEEAYEEETVTVTEKRYTRRR